MTTSARPTLLLSGDTPRRWQALGAWLRRTIPGRILALGAAIKITTSVLGLTQTGSPAVVGAVDKVGSVALLFSMAYAMTRLGAWAKRRFLWRVRRRLILSYIFIGVVPGLLVVSFFLLAGLLLFFNVASYLVQSRVGTLTDQARFLAQTTVLELQRSTTPAALVETIERRQSSAEVHYPFISLAVVPVTGRTCAVEPARAARVPRALPVSLPVSAGPWAHLDAPVSLPAWVPCDGFGGLVAYDLPAGSGTAAPGDRIRLVMRAAAFPELPNPTWAVVLDLPLSVAMEQRLQQEIGIQLGEVMVEGPGRVPVPGRAFEPPAAAPNLPAPSWSLANLRWVAFLEHVDWGSGERSNATAAIQINLLEIYNRLSVVSSTGIGGLTFGQLLLVVLAGIGALFLVIQCVALAIGFVLARQITGAVHDLFTGTQHVRAGDFSHQIPVRARDQLGELADSFNLMTTEVTSLLGEMAEKGRMEQEMSAAREIQQKLLPSGPLRVKGLAVTAFCEPAREVAGDYFDFLPIGDGLMGMLIADVSGKGLAAGLYMAQLKVIVQSLARMHHEPRNFLVAVNRIVSANIDSKSFITMAYGVVDIARQTMIFARAGHCPLIHVPADQPPGLRRAQFLAPDGLVVGLQIDDGTLFEGLLQEQTIAVRPGDVVVWFTDGITETMNEAFECFGEARLARVVEQHAHLPFDQLRSHIMADLRAFAGAADQHDDMTMILMKLEAA